MMTTTSTPQEKDSNPNEHHEPSTSLADRLKGLASEVWAHEQDGAIHGDRGRRLETAIQHMEAVLADEMEPLDNEILQISPRT